VDNSIARGVLKMVELCFDNVASGRLARIQIALCNGIAGADALGRHQYSNVTAVRITAHLSACLAIR
jgi:hypothetical protein